MVFGGAAFFGFVTILGAAPVVDKNLLINTTSVADLPLPTACCVRAKRLVQPKHSGSSQNHGPILAPLNTRCRNIIYNHKGP